jgi:hypothetical protein
VNLVTTDGDQMAGRVTVLDLEEKSNTPIDIADLYWPTADDSTGLLLAAEQECWCTETTDGPSTLRAFDLATLREIASAPMTNAIASIDSVRGWVLVTLRNGQTLVVDPLSGETASILNDARSAVWVDAADI